MPDLMTTEQIKNERQQIEEMTEALEAQRLALEERRAEQTELATQISETKTRLDTLTNERTEKENAIREATRTIFSYEGRINESHAMLESNARLQKIEDLYREQTPFLEALEKRLERKQEELREETGGFIEFAEPSKVVQRIESQMNRAVDFQDSTIEMRSARHNYQEAVRSLCERKIDGSKISPADAMSHLIKLDAFLMSNHISGLWQLG